MLKFRHLPLAVALAASLAGCGGGGDSPATGPAPSGYAAAETQFALAASSEHALVNPIVAATPGMGSPDPSVVFRDGYYHYCRTLPGGAIGIAKARRLQDIGTAPMVTIWTPPPGTTYSQQVWAPELQYLRGRWYVYFAASDGVIANHRMYVLEGPVGDAQGAYAFKGKLAPPTDRYAIDGIALESAGRLYFVWSGWRKDGDAFPQVLYIAPMSDPLTISGERHEIAAPDRAWESVEAPLVEGPAVLQRDGRIHIVYSASASWSDDYKLGLLSFSGGNILDAAAWSKHDTPVFVKRPAAGVYGPGHNSFVKSPDGLQDWIVYHAIDHSGGGWLNRSVRAQPFAWSADGLPRFGRPVQAGVALAEPSGTPTALRP
ncbi:glycoside hydrolase family 43 protein [Azohydromonas aeria]|uniref:glycoside hydrolase family 43 protein n=1 Tax=Azohydromonas aeria TaxID=2590212 RepID=UPI0012FCE425|nr:glycoside hydrolase family 43 protein [Azohydromonas aeria]